MAICTDGKPAEAFLRSIMLSIFILTALVQLQAWLSIDSVVSPK